jgi:hypothetical protein
VDLLQKRDALMLVELLVKPLFNESVKSLAEFEGRILGDISPVRGWRKNTPFFMVHFHPGLLEEDELSLRAANLGLEAWISWRSATSTA